MAWPPLRENAVRAPGEPRLRARDWFPIRASSACASGHGFYVGMGVAILLATVVGFSRSVSQRASEPGFVFTPAVVVHGALFFGWVVLFLAQAVLVASGRTGVHRRLGVLGAIIAVAMVVISFPLALSAARRGAFGDDSLAFLLVILVDLVGFACFVAAAVYYRRRSETHKRLMLLAMMSLLPPVVFRWPYADRPGVFLGLMLLFIAAPLVHDRRSRRRLHPVSLWGGLALLVSGPLRLAVAHSETWHRVAVWLTR